MLHVKGSDGSAERCLACFVIARTADMIHDAALKLLPEEHPYRVFREGLSVRLSRLPRRGILTMRDHPRRSSSAAVGAAAGLVVLVALSRRT